VIVREDEAMSVHDGVLGSGSSYSCEYSCQCMVSGLSDAFSVSCSKGTW
jgi:hypothetical protein